MTREKMTIKEIEDWMDELTRQFAATRDPEIREELYRLSGELEKLDKESSERVPMLLRHHPLMSYRGNRSWPPTWTWTGGLEDKSPRGEIGILWQVVPSNVLPANRCFLYMYHERSSYIGCLLIDDTAFCSQIMKLLQDCCNRPIAEIGSLDLSHTL